MLKNDNVSDLISYRKEQPWSCIVLGFGVEDYRNIRMKKKDLSLALSLSTSIYFITKVSRFHSLELKLLNAMLHYNNTNITAFFGLL